MTTMTQMHRAALATVAAIPEPNMELDWLIFTIAAVAGIFTLSGSVLMAWSGLNIALLNWYVSTQYWDDVVLWAILFCAKDFALMVLAGWMRLPLIIILGIATSCLFHQVLSWQIFTYTWENVTLIDDRSFVMMCLSAGMLATVILDLMGGGTNGGRRIVNYRFRSDGRFNSVLHLASQKVIK